MAEETTSTTTGAENTTVENTESKSTETEAKKAEQNTQQSENDKIDKIVQSRVDRAMAEERKKSAELQKQLDKMKKEKLSEEELKQLEIEEREKAIADKEKAIADKENRLFAIKAIKEAGLDDGSDESLNLVDLVINGVNDTEETIKNKVNAVKSYCDKRVAAEVDKTFKKNGRVPNGANVSTETKETSDIAVKLGKERAEQNKKANDVLSYYTGGKK